MGSPQSHLWPLSLLLFILYSLATFVSLNDVPDSFPSLKILYLSPHVLEASSPLRLPLPSVALKGHFLTGTYYLIPSELFFPLKP